MIGGSSVVLLLAVATVNSVVQDERIINPCFDPPAKKFAKWTSPGFDLGMPYTPNYMCHTMLEPDMPMRTVVRVKSLEVEGTAGKCTKDFISIAGAYGKRHTLCGAMKNNRRYIPLAGSVGKFMFWTNYYKEKKGFELIVSSQKDKFYKKVMLNIGDTGFIQSPQFPHSYPERSLAEWWLEAPVGYQIQIESKVTRLRKYDYVLVDLSGNKWYHRNTTFKLERTTRTATIRSANNKLSIAFYGWSPNQGRPDVNKFSIRYKVVKE